MPTSSVVKYLVRVLVAIRTRPRIRENVPFSRWFLRFSGPVGRRFAHPRGVDPTTSHRRVTDLALNYVP
jgi:hypothetical protein